MSLDTVLRFSGTVVTNIDGLTGNMSASIPKRVNQVKIQTVGPQIGLISGGMIEFVIEDKVISDKFTPGKRFEINLSPSPETDTSELDKILGGSLVTSGA